MAENEQDIVEEVAGDELVVRANDHTSIRALEDGGFVLEGRMMPYNEWTEVRSSIEGHFMERFAPGSLVKTMAERAKQIRVLFEHGLDRLGKQSIAAGISFEDRGDGAYYDATLFRSVPDLITEGLRHGVYGSSIRYRPVKMERVRSPKPSEQNPAGIPEHTIREAYVQEFSVVSFPQYEGATASVRSLTDEFAARQLLGDPEKLLELAMKRSEPQHSEREEQEPVPERSRSTQPPDYLTESKEEAWRL